MKNNKGITLVALVVTIVVLLILAGVSINSVLGENGIIIKAKEAAEKTAAAQEKEMIERNLLEQELEGDCITTWCAFPWRSRRKNQRKTSAVRKYLCSNWITGKPVL